MSTEVATIDTQIEEFKALFNQGLENIAKAAAVYVNAIDENPNNHERFMHDCPQIPASAWSGFEAVGRGWMDYRLLLNGSATTRTLRKLPRSQQQTALDEGVEVLLRGDGEKETLIVKVENLEPAQRKQVFAKDHIRTLGEQRAWLENQYAPPAKEYRAAYEIRRGVLHINAATQMTRKEVARILLEMEG
jgi:hypothetical protein